MNTRCMVLGMAGIMSIGLAGGMQSAQAEENVTVTVGKTRSARFHKQVAKVRVSSSNINVVKVRYREGYGVQLLGVTPGTATVHVTGEIVRYETGIPARRSGGIVGSLGELNHVPLTNNRPFENTYRVKVVATPEEKIRPEHTDASPVQTVVRRVQMRVGQSLRQRTWMQAMNVDIQNPAGNLVATSFRRGNGLEFQALRSGMAQIVVTGEIVYFQNGQPQFTPARYVYNVTISD